MIDRAEHTALADNGAERLFDSKAAAWTAKYQADGALKDRLELFHLALAARVPAPAKVLDFGCGSGNLARYLHALGYGVTGCDISQQMIAVAERDNLGQSRPAFVRLESDWRTLPFADDHFDAVVASSVFEYLDDVDGVVAELIRILTPAGVIIFNVPNLLCNVRRVERVVRRIAVSGRFVLPLTGRLARAGQYLAYLHTSKNRWALDEWQERLRSHGLSAVPAPTQSLSRHGGPTPLTLLIGNQLEHRSGERA